MNENVSMLAGQQESLLPGRQGTQRADGHCVCRSLPAHVFERHWERTVLVQHVVWHHHSEGGGNAEICHKTNEKRCYDSKRNGPLGILHLFSWRKTNGDCEEVGTDALPPVLKHFPPIFFTSGGNAVKSDEGVKTGGSTGQDSSPAKGHEAAGAQTFHRDEGLSKTKSKKKKTSKT